MQRSTRITTVADLRRFLDQIPDSAPVEIQRLGGDVPTVARTEALYDETNGVLVIEEV